jgi:sec-independent protein translocase protein TatA
MIVKITFSRCIFAYFKKRVMSVLLFGLGAPEIVVIVLVVLLLFGGRKIPELMRGLGQGIREFNNAKNQVKEQIKEGTKDDSKKESE